MTTGEKLKAWRKKRHLSQQALETRSGVSQSAISAIELDSRSPSLDTIQMLAQALRIDPSALMDDNKKQPATDVSGLDDQLIEMLVNLSDSDVQRVKDFVAGLKAAQRE